MREATRLAARIKAERGIDVELVKGSGGIYEVFKEDALIFSKKSTGRFPEDDEVLGQL